MPNTVIWSYNSKNYQISNPHKIIALLLEQANKIAVIENMHSQTENKAYILSANGTVLWDLKKLLRDQLHHSDYGYYFFCDISYIDNELYFFINIHSDDFRFSFNLKTGAIGRLIYTK